MPIRPADVCTVANDLIANSGEAYQRSAMSRHFYAALHAMSDWLQKFTPASSGSTGGMHQAVAGQLRNLDPKTTPPQSKARGKVLAAQLEVLKKRRVLADYLLKDQISPGEAAAQAALAAKLLAEP